MMNQTSVWQRLSLLTLLCGLSLALGACSGGSEGEGGAPAAECGNGTVEDGEACDDGNTDDGDGCAADCTIETGGGDAEICDDGEDNDGDGASDCDDSDCADDPACDTTPPAEICDDGEDNDGDEAIDCDDDDCADDAACATPAEICDDGEDNDGDEAIDCDDDDCADDEACATPAEICDDGEDNDGDEAIDCEDDDCADDEACATPAEVCDDGEDNDGDELTDCEDDDCADDEACAIPDEVCDDGEDNDGDELIDCEDDDCADAENCQAFCGDGNVDEGEECDDGELNADEPGACRTDCTLPACGDGIVDTDSGEVCDSGVDNSDFIPNACRTTCQEPACGDLIIDDAFGETCDDGDANGVDAACSDICVINTAVACADAPDFFILDDVAEFDGTTFSWVGSFAGTTDDSTPPAGCVELDAPTDVDLTFEFVAPFDGDFALSTATLGTVADTVMFVTSGCQDGIPGECSDNTGASLGSTLFLRDLSAGDARFITLERVTGSADLFELRIEPVVSFAGDGDACGGTGIYCDTGLECIEGVCGVNVAPTITNITTIATSATAVRHVFEGTDANQDVVDWTIETVVMRDGAVFNGLAINAGPFFAYEGENWTMEFALEFDGLSAEGVGPDTITYSVFDAAGNVSNTFETVVPEFAEPATGLAEGDPCDITRLANVCDEPFTCTDTGDATVCGDAVAPTFDAVRVERVDAETIRIFVDGVDPNGDVASLVFTALDATGTVINDGAADIADIEFGFDIAPAGRTSFGLYATLTGGLFGIESELATMELALRDDAALDSAVLTAELPGLAVVGAGEACDPDGVVSVCEAALDCSPTEAGGAVCIAPQAPEVISFEAGFGDIEGVPTLIFDIVGRDVNADVAQFNMNLYLQDGRFLDIGAIFVAGAVLADFCEPSANGRVAFTCQIDVPTEFLPDTGGVPWDYADLTIVDERGLESTTVEDGVNTEGAEGEVCDVITGEPGCDRAAGLVCGVPDDETGLSVCEINEAPSITSVSVLRTGSDEIQIIVEGSDPNGNVTDLEGTLTSATGDPVTLSDLLAVTDFNFPLDNTVLGQGEFTVTATFNIPAFSTLIGAPGVLTDFNPDPANGSFVLVDSLELRSDAADATVPALVAEGEACVGDGVTDVCVEGTNCIDGICQSAAPTIVTASATTSPDSDRFLQIEVTGRDADEDIETFSIEFFDGEGVSVFEGAIDQPAELDEPFGTFYVDGDYTYSTEFLWTQPLLYGVADAEVTVTDSLGNTAGPFAFTFRPIVGLGETCDLAEVDALCVVGFYCADSLTCEVDELDLCGGIEVIDAYAVGEEVEGVGTFVPFSTIGAGNNETILCEGAFGPSAGDEVVLTANFAENQLVTVTTATDLTGDLDTYLYVREEFCTVASVEVTCNDDIDADTFQSEVTFVALAGIDYYIYVDGYAGANGAGEALFITQPVVFEGEDCSASACEPGTFCSADNLCVPPSDVGGACDDFVPCVDGLFCSGEGICTEPAEPGAACDEFVGCVAGYECVENLCVEAATSCTERDLIPSDATTFSGTWTDEFDDYDVAGCHTFGGGRSPEKVFEWVSDYDGLVQVDLLASAMDDTVLLLSEGVCGVTGPEFLECNDDFEGLLSGIQFAATSGTSYFFFVEAWNGVAPADPGIVVTLTRL